MTSHPADELSAYLDGDLDAAATRAVASHLDACASCRAVVADLERLRHEVGAWATETAVPPSDLWPAIAARLSPPGGTQAGPTEASSRTSLAHIAWYKRRVSLGLPELAMAATLVAAMGAGMVYQRGPAPVAVPMGPVPIVAEMEPVDAPDAGVATVSFADAQYDAAVNDLELVLQEQRQRLNPRTVLVLERNLRVIDEAVREARAALADDPANALLNAQLADVRRRKLQLLRKAASITEGD